MSSADLAGDMPSEIEDIFRYCRELEFEDRPEYGMLTKMLDSVLLRANFTDLDFDWKKIHVSK